MKIPFVLPVYYDEHNETINDKNHAVIYHCGWPTQLTYEMKKEKGLFAVAVLNGEIRIVLGPFGYQIDNSFGVADGNGKVDNFPNEIVANGHSKVKNPWGRAGKPK